MCVCAYVNVHEYHELGQNAGTECFFLMGPFWLPPWLPTPPCFESLAKGVRFPGLEHVWAHGTFWQDLAYHSKSVAWTAGCHVRGKKCLCFRLLYFGFSRNRFSVLQNSPSNILESNLHAVAVPGTYTYTYIYIWYPPLPYPISLPISLLLGAVPN